MWSNITAWVSSHRVISIVAAVAILGAGTAAFMLAGEEPTTTTTTSAASTTTSTAAATTTSEATTTTVPGAVSQINGLPVEDPAVLDRRLLAVKIDNHPNARPQTGIQDADVVWEYMAEGVTRFMAFWQQSESEYLGPMRSARPTDQTLLAYFNEPTLAISGGQSWVREMIANVGVHIIGEVEPATFRSSARPAPHNLYANTELLREYADEQGYPDEPIDGPMWEFGPMRDDAEEAAKVSFDFLGNPVEWTWDEASGTWLRSIAGDESNTVTPEGEESQIGFPVLIAMYVVQDFVGDLPTSRTTGQGLAYIFADGKVVQGTWQRDDIDQWFTFADNDGEQILVPPGQAWISLVPDTTGIAIE
jgi:hypothetical protein